MAKKPLHIDPIQILTFPFRDQNWLKKLLISSLLVFFSFIPVFPIVLLLGYAAEIIRRIAVDHESPTLPEWDDLGAYFNQGIRLFGVAVVYLIPAILLTGFGYLGMLFPVILTEIVGMAETEALVFIIAGNLVGFGFMGLGVMVSMVTGLFLPVSGTHAVVSQDFKSAFRFKEIWSIFKANWGGFIIVFLIMIGSAFVLYYLTYILAATVILCCLYPFALCFMSAYLILIGAGYFGNAYREALLELPD